jgi:hypothetical protein
MKKSLLTSLCLLFLSMTGMTQSKISNCYNVGVVSGANSKVGGVAGYLSSTVTVSNCYYKTFNESNTLSGTTSKVDSDLKSLGLVSNLNSTEDPKPFSSDNFIQINSGYPILSWQNNTITLNSGIVNSTDYSTSKLENCDVIISSGEFVINQASVSVKSVLVAPRAKLSIGSNTLIATNGITLQSDASGTATLMDNYSSRTIAATVQQYVEEGRNWYISSPVYAAGYSTLNKGTSVVEFNEITKNWDPVTTGNLIPGKGYVEVATNTPLVTGTTGTVNFIGALNSGEVTVPLTRTGSTSAGFNLVGNPYPSYLDWSLVSTANPNIIPTAWFRTKNGSGSYIFTTVNVATPSSPIIVNNNANTTITKYIPPMQAYWVRIAGGQSSINYTVTNAMRNHADNISNTMKVRSQIQQQLLRLQVSNGISKDETVLYYNPNAQDFYDMYDSPKMSNANNFIPEIYTTVGNDELVINGMKNVISNSTIKLGFRTGENNKFSIQATEFSNFDSDTRIILHDNQTNIDQDLTDGIAYTFASKPTITTDRFCLIFKSNSVSTGVNIDNSNSIFVYKNTNNRIAVDISTEIIGKASVSIYNVIGHKLENKLLTQAVNVLSKSYTSGVYLVSVLYNGKTITSKLIIN